MPTCHVPDDMANRLKKLRSQAAERPDNAELLNALPSAAIEPAAILEALRVSRLNTHGGCLSSPSPKPAEQG